MDYSLTPFLEGVHYAFQHLKVFQCVLINTLTLRQCVLPLIRFKIRIPGIRRAKSSGIGYSAHAPVMVTVRVN